MELGGSAGESRFGWNEKLEKRVDWVLVMYNRN